ncbi:MAG TPA: hypothetical protein VGI81_10630 [Tepidisphaeraceae bacterium]|jgi:hypothetical protein
MAHDPTMPAIGRGLTAAAAISLLLCIATAALGLLSYARPIGPIRLPGSTATSYRELALARGYVALSHTQWLVPNPAAATAPFPGYPYGAELSEWTAMGLHWRHEGMTLQRPGDGKVVMVLTRSNIFAVWLGLPMLLSAVLPAWWMIRSRKLKRKGGTGTCRVCGYDLRASTERCPECGTPIPRVDEFVKGCG